MIWKNKFPQASSIRLALGLALFLIFLSNAAIAATGSQADATSDASQSGFSAGDAEERAQAKVSAMTAARFLEQSSWGPTKDTIAQVQQVGLSKYLSQQFSAPLSNYPRAGNKNDLTVMQKQFFVNATTGKDQLRQRLSFALSEIMVVSALKTNDSTAFKLWMNMLQKDALGNFYDLLKDVTLSPTMGHYLDMGNNDGCDGCARITFSTT